MTTNTIIKTTKTSEFRAVIAGRKIEISEFKGERFFEVDGLPIFAGLSFDEFMTALIQLEELLTLIVPALHTEAIAPDLRNEPLRDYNAYCNTIRAHNAQAKMSASQRSLDEAISKLTLKPPEPTKNQESASPHKVQTQGT